MRQKITIPIERLQIGLIPNIVYAQKPFWFGHSSRSLKLDLLKPRSDRPLPLIIWVCGGAWVMMEKSYHLPEMVHLAEQGFAVASVEYRTTNECTFPSQIEDIKDAIRFLRAHASEYNLDPKHFGIMGESAGGYLSILAGTSGSTRIFDTGDYLEQSSAVQAVCDWYGPSDFLDFAKENDAFPASPEALLLGGPAPSIPEQTAAADPCTYLSPETPPFLILHGNDDHTVPFRQSEILYERLTANGTPVDFYEIDGAEHADRQFVQPVTRKLILDFFTRYLKSGDI